MREENFERLDTVTKEHSIRVAELSMNIAKELGYQSTDLFLTALYHDIGKLKISDSILFKPDRLTDVEFTEMKKHPIYGYAMMEKLFTQRQCEIILYHHENEDGSGYFHKKGKDIPFESKIIRVADVYDALVSQRCYKSTLSQNETMDIMQKSIGMFDRTVFDALYKITN